MIIKFAFGLFLISTVCAPITRGKAWHEITPLHSSAADVAKLFPACSESETRCQFTINDQEVMVIFSGSKVGVLECVQLPKRTVLAVIIKFRQRRNLREFKYSHKRYEVFDSSTPPKRGYKAYFDAGDGFIINTYRRKVIGLVYIGARKDLHLCPQYYQDPKAFVDVGLVQ